MNILLILFFLYNFSYGCNPNEIHIREQWIPAYERNDGTKVSSHLRSEHCRKINVNFYFQNISVKKVKDIDNFKKWKDAEKKLVDKLLSELPAWLRKYKFSEILRADKHSGNDRNPALTIPSSKSIVIFDNFFEKSNQRDILLHEVAHIAAWDIEPDSLKSFFEANDWKYENNGKIIPPKRTILPDSIQSPSEDFANSVEIYYSDRARLKKFNPKSFEILDLIINKKENIK